MSIKCGTSAEHTPRAKGTAAVAMSWPLRWDTAWPQQECSLATGTVLKGVTLSETRQTETHQHCMSSLPRGVQTGKTIEEANQTETDPRKTPLVVGGEGRGCE